MTTLEQIKQKGKELNKAIEDFIAEKFIEDEATQGEWKPKFGDHYWLTTNYGEVFQVIWDGFDNDIYRLSIGNCFQTREQAEKYKLRLESMKPKYLPKDGEKYWYVNGSRRSEGFIYDWYRWKNDGYDSSMYLLGRTFKTEQEAQDWITNYAKAWEL